MAAQSSASSFDRPRSARRFFKIILQSSLEEQKLGLPLEFLRNYRDDLSHVAELTVCKSKIWQVRLTFGRNNVWFDNGWHEFAEFYAIRYGFFLMFKYMGLSSFSVRIFNKTACEILYPLNQIIISDDEEKQPRQDFNENGDDNDCFEISGSDTFTRTTSKRKYRSSHRNLCKFSFGSSTRHGTNSPTSDRGYKKNENRLKIEEIEIDSGNEEERGIIVTRNFYRIFPSLSLESKRAVKASRLYNPKHPAFMSIISQQNLRTNLYIPVKFSHKYLHKKSTNKIRLRLSDEKHWQKEWLVRPLWRDWGGLLWTEGWSVFSGENGLRFGDVCIFELIDFITVVFKAKIFHACLDG